MARWDLDDVEQDTVIVSMRSQATVTLNQEKQGITKSENMFNNNKAECERSGFHLRTGIK